MRKIKLNKRYFILMVIASTVLASVIDWSSILDAQDGSKVNFGVVLEGSTPFARNDIKEYSPASVTKLFTTATALALLGSDYRFETKLQFVPVKDGDFSQIQNLRIIGSGDPSFGLRNIDIDYQSRVGGIVKDLVDRGLRELKGDIEVVSDDSRWDHLSLPPGWSGDDLDYCYGSLPGSFVVNEGCATYQVKNESQGQWVHAGVNVSVDLEITVGAQTELSAIAVNDFSKNSYGFKIRGTWKKGSTEAQQITLPLLDQKAWVKGLFLAELKNQGVKLSSIDSSMPKGLSQELSYFSLPLKQIIQPINKFSINVAAEALQRKLGQKFGRADLELREAGTEVVHHYLESLITRSTDINLLDGSGLSRLDRVTPQALDEFLKNLMTQSFFNDFFNSLTIAGVDGTLKDRMKGTAAEGHVRGKTGTLSGVYNLAGYVSRDGTSEPVPFLVLSKTTSEYRTAARAAQDRVGVKMAENLNQ